MASPEKGKAVSRPENAQGDFGEHRRRLSKYAVLLGAITCRCCVLCVVDHEDKRRPTNRTFNTAIKNFYVDYIYM